MGLSVDFNLELKFVNDEVLSSEPQKMINVRLICP